MAGNQLSPSGGWCRPGQKALGSERAWRSASALWNVVLKIPGMEELPTEEIVNWQERQRCYKHWDVTRERERMRSIT